MHKFDKNRMQVFANFPAAEQAISQEITQRISGIMLSQAKNGERAAHDVIAEYLADKEWEDRLKAIIGLSGGSLERLKRILFAITGTQVWPNLEKDEGARLIISQFLASPNAFASQIPGYIRRCFRLRDGWVGALRDKQQVTDLVIDSLKSSYAVKCGLAQEEKINNELKRLQISCGKGKCSIVNDKEVDVVIPSLEAPRILIMSAYHLTTSSGQSARANEQTLMYEDVQRHNRRKRDTDKVLLWNVIDGGGWLARDNDLETILRHADANFCNADIDDGTFAKILRQVF